MGASPIDSYEGADVVYTFGAGSFGTVLFFVLAVAVFIVLLARVAQHENKAYKAIAAKQTPAPGPVVEGAPEVAAV